MQSQETVDMVVDKNQLRRSLQSLRTKVAESAAVLSVTVNEDSFFKEGIFELEIEFKKGHSAEGQRKNIFRKITIFFITCSFFDVQQKKEYKEYKVVEREKCIVKIPMSKIWADFYRAKELIKKN